MKLILFVVALQYHLILSNCKYPSVKSEVLSLRTATIRGQEVTFRVINGKPAKLGDVPFQVALTTLSRKTREFVTFCGGSIIGNNKVLSAAHCVEGREESICSKGQLSSKSLKGVYVVAGTLCSKSARVYEDNETHGQWRQLKSGRYPSGYNFPELDIAVLVTKKGFIYNIYVAPIPLATETIDYGGKDPTNVCQVSGYGRINPFESSEFLLVAGVNILSNEICSFVHHENMDMFVCTSDLVSDVHKGDSGGPLVCWGTGDPNEDNTTGLLIGVVSGKKFGMLLSTFFSRVSAYNDFINECARPKFKIWVFGFAILNLALSFLLYRVLLLNINIQILITS